MSEPVIVEVRKRTQLWLRLNRPHDQNRIDTRAMELISEGLDRVDDDPAIAVIVLTGDEHHFCSGGRVDTSASDEEKKRYARAITSLHERLHNARPPVIAAVSGHCRAGGMAILAGADVAIAADDVSFGFPEINHGGFPVMAMASALPLLPPKVAFDLFYTGRDMTAGEALSFGLVSRLSPREAFSSDVESYADDIAARDPETMSLGRQAYHAMSPMSPDSRLAYGREILKSVLRAK
jgi:enoyl-CoA hydratase/carnithine racemase